MFIHNTKNLPIVMINMVIISGANNGLGLELTKIFCSKKYKVIAFDIKTNNLKKLEYNNLTIIKGNINKRRVIKKIINVCKCVNKEKIILFNNAAFSCLEKNPYIKYKYYQKILNTNLISPILLSDYLLYNYNNVMIVNILSKVAYSGNRNAIYSVSKWGLRGYSESLKEIYKNNKKVKIINVVPCSMKTSYWDNKPIGKDKLTLIDPNIIANKIYDHTIINNDSSDLFIKKEEYLN